MRSNDQPRIETASILIVDDEPVNIEVLEQILMEAGFSDVRTTSDPREVMGIASANPPDLLALDLFMPHMDGFEIIHRLREEGFHESRLPILVLTADVSEETRQRALALGANDFLSKPFDLLEVVLRVRNLLRTRVLYRTLEEQNDVLEDRVRERTRALDSLTAELEELNRTKSELIQILAHELFTPITTIQGSVLTIQRLGNQIGSDDIDGLLRGIDAGTNRLQRLVGNLRAAAALDRPTVRLEVIDTPVSALLMKLEEDHPKAGERIQVVDGTPGGSMLLADVELAAKALSIVVENALDLAPPGSVVEIVVSQVDGSTEISVADQGPGVPDDYRTLIFDAFTQTEESVTRTHEGIGIGLFLAARIMLLHGGEIRTEPRSGGGSLFTLGFRSGADGSAEALARADEDESRKDVSSPAAPIALSG
ncbi:MAG TPA: response regulator [Actinomycetota bacterium]|nr:response regulator [Actinomycetota bacterium]